MTTCSTPALAAVLAAALLAFPASAQDGPAAGDEMVMTDEADLFCEPGSLGVAGEYAAPAVEDGAVTRALIAFQCGEFLADGTYIPEGYRMQVHYDCAPQECTYPFVFALPTHRPEFYAGRIDGQEARRSFRIRLNGRGQLIMNVSTVERGTRERMRQRFVLDPVE